MAKAGDVMELVEHWNALIPSHPIRQEDFLRPTAPFFMGAVAALLRFLEVPVEGLTAAERLEGAEAAEALEALGPPLRLGAAVNLLLVEMAESPEESEPISCGDLVSPLRPQAFVALKRLVNFALFALQRREDVRDGEERADEREQALVRLALDKDRLKIEIDQTHQTEDQIRKDISKMKKEIAHFGKTADTPQHQLDDLISQCQKTDEETAAVDSSLHFEEAMHDNLVQQIQKLKTSSLTDGEQAEVLAHKEAVMKRQKDLSDKIEDARSALAKKETDTRALEEICRSIAKYDSLWDQLIKVHDGKKELQESNKSARDKRDELSGLEAAEAGKVIELAELEEQRALLSDKYKKIDSEAAHDIQKNTSEERALTEDYHNISARAADVKSKIKSAEEESLRHQLSHKNLTNKFADEIPAHYTSIVAGYISRVENMLERLKAAKDNE